MFLTTRFRTPSLDQEQLDRDLGEEEEEGLLTSTGRRCDATWQDITEMGPKNTADEQSVLMGIKLDFGGTRRVGICGERRRIVFGLKVVFWFPRYFFSRC